MSPLRYQLAKAQFSTPLAILSFGIGTVLFLLHLLFPQQHGILIIGLYYVFLAFVTNLILLLYLIYCFLALHHHRDYFGIKILILVANIPIAICYYLIIVNQHQIFF